MPNSPKHNVEVIFRPFFISKNGKKIYARNYGKKAWPIPVNKKE